MSSLSFQDLKLRPAQWRAVEKRARNAGKTPPEYVRSLIERELLAGKSFDDMLRPIRDDFRRSGITPDQLDQIVRRARRISRGKSRKTRP